MEIKIEVYYIKIVQSVQVSEEISHNKTTNKNT